MVAEDRYVRLQSLQYGVNNSAVILQDLGLPPDEEGVEGISKLFRRSFCWLPATKIIVVTGYHDPRTLFWPSRSVRADFYKSRSIPTLDLIVQRVPFSFMTWKGRRLNNTQASPCRALFLIHQWALRVCRTVEKRGGDLGHLFDTR